MADQTPSKKTIERSAANPGIPLEEAIDAAQTLRKNLGATSTYSRESAAVALGYAGLSGAANRKIAACVHFGLLVREGNVYRQSDIADQFFNYTSEEERTDALRAAVQKPALYAKVITDFGGQSLPGMLENILVRNYGIVEKAAKEVAKTFRQSAEYAGVLVNGVLNGETQPTSTSSSESEAVDERRDDDRVTDLVRPKSPLASDQLPVTIPNTDVTILFPLSYAYDLSVGAFKVGIEALSKNIREVHGEAKDESAPAPED